jgi:IgA-specific serine endopeptidase
VERTLVVEQAQIAKKVALVTKQKEQETAEILKKQAVEVAERAKEVAVAEKEQERASAQSAMLTAEADREAAKQKIVTVQVTADADREASKKLISAQQQVNERKIREQTEADVAAYSAIKKAEAEKQAAEMLYQAKLKLAEGDAASSTKRAEGDRALRMVDVNVEREKVNVEQARVDVERKSLSNKQEFEGAALKFELEKLRIEMEKAVRIAAAEAMGNMLAKAQMQIFGDPETMARMSQRFMQAASLGMATDGLMRTLPPQGQELLNKIASAVVTQLQPTNGTAEPTPGLATAAASAVQPKSGETTKVEAHVTDGKPAKRT